MHSSIKAEIWQCWFFNTVTFEALLLQENMPQDIELPMADLMTVHGKENMQ